MSKKKLILPDTITVGELASELDLPVTKLIGELFKNGIMATVNQRIDLDTVQIIVDELGLEVDIERRQAETIVESNARLPSADALPRPPIVAVMGHVDHGKTSLLDAILSTDTAAHEAGGITQHLSAYQVVYKGRTITLLDTPGHEAFSALRQHGATLTDVAVIVVAADDGVKPQTVEAIRFAQQAKAKIVVAINKVDKPDADVARVKSQLAEHELVPEEWGGTTVMVEVSAKTRLNVDKLLDLVLLVADLEDLRADQNVPGEGLVIEARMHTGRGPVVNILIGHGTVSVGDHLAAGSAYGKIRTLSDFANRPIKQAGPSTPAIASGFKELPQFGDHFAVYGSEKEARAAAQSYYERRRKTATTANLSASDLLGIMTKRDERQQFNVVIKADVQGSLTSVMDSLKLLGTDKVELHVLESGVGAIAESDLKLAASSGAVIYGFNVSVPATIKRRAESLHVSIRTFKIIYELIDDAKLTMTEMLSPDIVDTNTGALVIRGIFKITKAEVICGGEVTEGKAEPNTMVHVLRQSKVVGDAEVTNVQRNRQDAKEILPGELCGLRLKTKSKLEIAEGDTLQFFRREVRKAVL